MSKILYTPSEFDQELYDYGYIVLKQYIRYFFITSILCILLGCISEFLYFNIIFIPQRKTLGGFHFNNEKMCFIGSVLLGVATSFGAIHAPHIPLWLILILFGFCISLSLYCGCIDHPNKPLSPIEKNHYLKKGIIVEIRLLIITLFLSYYGYDSLTAISVFSIAFCSLGNYFVKLCHLNTK